MIRNCITVILLFITAPVFARQSGGNVCSESKIEHYTQLNKTDEITYPGDSSIDVVYYKLEIDVFTNPDYINGIVTVGAKPASSDISQFFLDLEESIHLCIL